MTVSGLVPDGTMVRQYQPPLRQVLSVPGSHVLSVAYTPDENLPCGEPVVHDPDDRLEDRPGCVLLAVGARATSPKTAELVRQAAQHGYHAVVIKDRGAALDELIATAEQSGIALLVAAEKVPWRQLDALLTAAVSGPGTVSPAYASVGMGDLFALANAIAMTIGGATCIEDTQGNVLAYSNLPDQEIDETRKLGILGRKTPARPTNRIEYSRVFQADGPVRFASSGPGHTPRLAIAVRAGAQLLGFIWVLDGTPPVVPEATALLEEVAPIAALHMLRARNPVDQQRAQRASTLRGLLDGTVAASSAAAHLGLPATTPVAVLSFAPTIAASEPSLAVASIVDVVSLCCEAWQHEAVCATAWGRVYAMLPLPPGTPAARLSQWAEGVAKAVRKSAKIDLHIGVGPVVEQLADAPTSRKVADQVVRVLAETAGETGMIATDEQVRSRIALLDLAERGLAEEELLDPVRRMLEHDRAHSSTHAITLLAYLDAFGDAAQAAAALTVHENTLRYRIRRLQELFDVDLADPAERLVIWLQLRLLRIRGELSNGTRTAGGNVASQR